MKTYIIMYLLTLILGLIIGKPVISFLKGLHASQTEREELKSHKKKEGTPTMGGFIFIIPIVVVSLVFFNYTKEALPVLALALGFGAIGFIDDFLKVVLRRSDGLIAWQKFLLQFVVCAVFLICFAKTNDTGIIIPFTNGYVLNLGYLCFPFYFFVIVGTVNGVNFTDGLDGLATSVTIVVTLFFISLGSAYMDFNFVVLGGLMAFLFYNKNPAKTFMGDTGSLFLGGFVSGMAIMFKMPVFILLFGFIYLCEVLSVIIQVTYFKKTHGKRIFRMAPIHHHFELGGWSEKKVVCVFSVVTAVLCVLAHVGL